MLRARNGKLRIVLELLPTERRLEMGVSRRPVPCSNLVRALGCFDEGFLRAKTIHEKC